MLFAEESSTPTTLLGILGILATGVSALLGMVVKWLLTHITELTKQSMELVGTRDKVMAEVQKDFKESLMMVVAHCEAEITRQTDWQKERNNKFEVLMERQIQALDELKDVIAGLHAKLLTKD